MDTCCRRSARSRFEQSDDGGANKFIHVLPLVSVNRRLEGSMNTAMVEKIEQVYYFALQLESPRAREKYLDRACRGSGEIRRMVDNMIALKPDCDRFFPEGGVMFILAEKPETTPEKPS